MRAGQLRPNAKVCDGQLKVMKCDATGTASRQVDRCDPVGDAKNVCLGGTCVLMACKAGDEIRANAGALAVCKADCTGYVDSPCGNGLACECGACVTTICAPNVKLSIDNKVQNRNVSGTNVTFVQNCADISQGCVGGACQHRPMTVRPVHQPHQRRTHIGAAIGASGSKKRARQV